MADADLPDETPDSMDQRRRRLLFRATHRGTREADLMIGGFVARHLAAFSDTELDELEAVLELLDVDLADWLTGRLPIPPDRASPMLLRMTVECAAPGAGKPR